MNSRMITAGVFVAGAILFLAAPTAQALTIKEQGFEMASGTSDAGTSFATELGFAAGGVGGGTVANSSVNTDGDGHGPSQNAFRIRNTATTAAPTGLVQLAFNQVDLVGWSDVIVSFWWMTPNDQWDPTDAGDNLSATVEYDSGGTFSIGLLSLNGAGLDAAPDETYQQVATTLGQIPDSATAARLTITGGSNHMSEMIYIDDVLVQGQQVAASVIPEPLTGVAWCLAVACVAGYLKLRRGAAHPV